jgi:hypothetical protein
MLWAMAGAAIVVAAATPAAPTPAVLMNFLRCMVLFPPVVAFMAPFNTATLACEIDFEKRRTAGKSLNICNVSS